MVGIQVRIENKSGWRFAGTEPVQEIIDERGLTGSDLPGQQDKPLAVFNSVGQFIHGGASTRRQIQKSRIRVNVERALAQSEKCFIHVVRPGLRSFETCLPQFPSYLIF